MVPSPREVVRVVPLVWTGVGIALFTADVVGCTVDVLRTGVLVVLEIIFGAIV